MTDHGEKIIYLIQEMLRKNNTNTPRALNHHIHANNNQQSQTLEATFLTAMTSATDSMAAASRSIHEDYLPANHYKRTEIAALIFYAAHQLNIDENSIRHDVHKAVGHTLKSSFSMKDYHGARAYLWMRLQNQGI